MLVRSHAMVRATGTAGCASCGSVAGHLAHEVPGAWPSEAPFAASVGTFQGPKLRRLIEGLPHRR